MSFFTERAFTFLSRLNTEVGTTLNWSANLKSLADFSMPELADFGSLWWLDNGEVRQVHSWQTDAAWARINLDLKFNCEWGPQRVFQSGNGQFRAHVVDDDRLQIWRPDQISLSRHISSYVCVPLIFQKKTVGALVLLRGHSRDDFNEQDYCLILEFAKRAAIALSNSQEHERAQTALHQQERNREASEDASRAKSMFLAHMSHEIRTPLTAIMGFTDLMLAHLQSTDFEMKDWAQRIRRNGHHMLKIINEILDVSKIESGQIEFEYQEFDLGDFLDDIESGLLPQAQKKKNRLYFEFENVIQFPVKTDPLRLKQILLNVIGNALKFTEDGEIRVKIRFNEARSEFIFEVTDTGIGLTPAQVGKLFQPYSQADRSHARRFGGTGLGLTLSRKLARALGGDVSLKHTAVGHGTCFQVSVRHFGLRVTNMLESARSKNAAAKNDSRAFENIETDFQSESFEDVHILLAEDSADYRHLVQQFLNNTGVQMDIAQNGQQALEYATRKSYDLILMDIQMPEKNGYEVCRYLRSNGYQGKVVALSAHAGREDREHAFEEGFDDYFSKPIERHHLLHLVRDCRRLQ